MPTRSPARSAFCSTPSLSGTRYRKTIDFARGLTAAATEAAPVTGGIIGSLALSPNMTLFGGHMRGFEEVAAAPANAANRGAAPPAIRTVQTGLGVRRAVADNLSLVVSAFTISKSYFSVDYQPSPITLRPPGFGKGGAQHAQSDDGRKACECLDVPMGALLDRWPNGRSNV